jgi:hypothetical protein
VGVAKKVSEDHVACWVHKPAGSVANWAAQELLTIAQAAMLLEGVTADGVVAANNVVVADRLLLVDRAADEVVAAPMHAQALESLNARGPF